MKYLFTILTSGVLATLLGIFTKQKTFTHRLALCVDILCASLIWSGYDVTISSRAGMAVRAKSAGKPYSKFLIVLAYLLNKLQANHVNLAIGEDATRATETLLYLAVPFTVGPLPVTAALPVPPLAAAVPPIVAPPVGATVETVPAPAGEVTPVVYGK